MAGEDLEILVRAAELHDVGKVAVPEAILDKRASLEPGERAIIERHSEVGERILAASPAMGPVARLVRSSHERFDGHGYPDGRAARRNPGRRPDHLRLRRLPRDDHRPALPQGHEHRRRDRRAASRGRPPVRPAGGRGLLRAGGRASRRPRTRDPPELDRDLRPGPAQSTPKARAPRTHALSPGPRSTPPWPTVPSAVCRYRLSHLAPQRASPAAAAAVRLAAGGVLFCASRSRPPHSRGPPTNISPPTITGTAQQGKTLTEHHGEWINFPTGYSYQWLRCNSSGTPAARRSAARPAKPTFRVAEDVGHELRVDETAFNGQRLQQPRGIECDRGGGSPGAGGLDGSHDHRHRAAGSDADRAPR